MKEWCRRTRRSGLAYVIIGLATHFLWVGLEVVLDGEVQPSKADSVIYLILMASLFKHFDRWVEV